MFTLVCVVIVTDSVMILIVEQQSAYLGFKNVIHAT